MGDNFSQIVVVDFEYEVTPGGLPNPLCMVAVVLDENFQYVRTIRMWRGKFGRTPPFDIGPNTLVVAYSAWAEMMCFLVLGWCFPTHIYDEHTTYLARTNLLLPYNPDETRKKQRKRLSDACRFYGIQGWQNIDKEAISEAIGNSTWREKYSHRRSHRLLHRRHLDGGEAFAPAVARSALPQHQSHLLLVGLQRQVHRPHSSARHAD
jgi:hypothetical protein